MKDNPDRSDDSGQFYVWPRETEASGNQIAAESLLKKATTELEKAHHRLNNDLNDAVGNLSRINDSPKGIQELRRIQQKIAAVLASMNSDQ